MKRLPLVATLIFLTLGVAFAGDDSNVINSLSQVNPASGNYGGSQYPQQIYNSLSQEDAGRSVEYGFTNFVVSGCLGPTSAGLVMSVPACIGYNAGFRAADPSNGSIGFSSSITFSNNATRGLRWTRTPPATTRICRTSPASRTLTT